MYSRRRITLSSKNFPTFVFNKLHPFPMVYIKQNVCGYFKQQTKWRFHSLLEIFKITSPLPTRDISVTIAPRYNEAPDITNSIFRPSNSKMYGTDPDVTNPR